MGSEWICLDERAVRTPGNVINPGPETAARMWTGNHRQVHRTYALCRERGGFFFFMRAAYKLLPEKLVKHFRAIKPRRCIISIIYAACGTRENPRNRLISRTRGEKKKKIFPIFIKRTTYDVRRGTVVNSLAAFSVLSARRRTNSRSVRTCYLRATRVRMYV